MSFRSSLALVALIAFAASGSTQSVWSFRSLTVNPPGDSPSMAFDSARGVAVLLVFNPTIGGGGRNETYEWNGTAWQLRSTFGPFSNPGLIRHAALAFDPVRNVSVFLSGGSWLLGSEFLLNSFTDTWEWDGSVWTNIPSGGIPDRCKHAMAYDAARNQMVMFGGLGNAGGVFASILGDTWLRSGQGWFRANPVTSPAPRHGHAMTYDATRQRVVLFGGTNRHPASSPLDPQPQTFQDTWEWDGTNWFEITTRNSPPARQEACLAYDARSRTTVLFGGVGGVGTVGGSFVALRDTWEYDGADWRLLQPQSSPARRPDAAIVCDSVRGNLLLFGGNTSYAPQSYLRDTWTFTPGARGTYATYGTGCPGSGGTPSLGSRLGEVPIAGQTFHAQVTGLPLVGPAYLFVGASRTQWGLVSLPFDLSSIGMQGCTLLASGDFLFPVTTVLGSGLCSFDVPLSLAGQSFYNQVIAFDPAANPTGLTVSNGAEAFVGN